MFAKPFMLLALVGLALGHMDLWWPPAIRGENNPFRQGEISQTSNYPIGCCGLEVPKTACRGQLPLLNTDQGKPVVTWAPGQAVNFSLSANHPNGLGGTHWGGSCQVGFSVDQGETFKVATTFAGSCPHRQGKGPSDQTFNFTVPADIPSGERVLFAWAWVNREKEYFHQCAVVSISRDGTTEQPKDTSTLAPKPSVVSTEAPSATSLPAQQTASSSAPSRGAHTKPSDSKLTNTVQQVTQYTLEGCKCSCPYQTWSPQCSCYDCKSPATKRHLVERAALELHRRHMGNAEKLNVPVRRSESVAFNQRPEMLLNIDVAGASCHSQGNPVELEYPNPGPDVVKGDDAQPLGLPEGEC